MKRIGLKDKLLFISLLIGVLGFFVKLAYRPYILSNAIDDFGIQGFLPTLFYVVGICLFITFLTNKNQVIAMGYGALGALAYEFEQIWTSRTFDFLDLFMVFAGYGVSVFIFKILTRRERNVQHG